MGYNLVSNETRLGAYKLSGRAGPYTMGDVMRITRASRSQLVHWTSCGLIHPNVRETHGTGHPRLFDLLNLVEVAVAVTLAGYSLPVRSLRRVIEAVPRAIGADQMLVTNDPYRGTGVEVYSGNITGTLDEPSAHEELRDNAVAAPVGLLINLGMLCSTVVTGAGLDVIAVEPQRVEVRRHRAGH